MYGDYRALLENPDLDAVVIGTPDHWHCLQMVEACEAGKDVYCEKPLANSIEESGLMVAAAKRYDRIVQIGQWQRSGPHWAEAIDFVHSGRLGRVRTVRAWAYMNWLPPVPNLPDEPAPEGVDYDMWLGPAPKRPFNRNRFHFNFRWYWDYAGGLMTDWGVHIIDIVLWGMQATAPNSIAASGGKLAYPDDAQETPDTLTALYEFDDFLMVWGAGDDDRARSVPALPRRGVRRQQRDPRGRSPGAGRSSPRRSWKTADPSPGGWRRARRSSPRPASAG